MSEVGETQGDASPDSETAYKRYRITLKSGRSFHVVAESFDVDYASYTWRWTKLKPGTSYPTHLDIGQIAAVVVEMEP